MHDDDHTAKCSDTLSQLLLVTTLMEEDMESGLADRGLTLTRAQVLWFLGEATQMTQRDLAAQLKVTPRNVTTLIDALEQTGFAKRTAHPTDRRAILVVLTGKGQQAFSTLKAETTEFAKQLFGHLSVAELDAFSKILGQVSSKLTEIAKADPNR
ncbi:MarR family winged helix-turn-helix transcriptional regulator [Devosia sp. SL43]|uniref:MarR family winged helix-turn-helix transcriptional regulator n=1 Tax=Devosia sp. SL43 TaxID=2806348 RepID=UPI001F367EDB|nr:MarR family transcriptional regulator [Devosia sp. SL43]UJW87258.1 MarR family transcriptional regulator [Devosia sp. SL43]